MEAGWAAGNGPVRPFSNHEGFACATAVLESRSTVAKPAAKKRSAPLDPHVADRLLDLLSSDDAFRSLFMSNPREALAQVGFVNETDLESPYWCFWGISKLASKRAIAEARCEIRNLLTANSARPLPNLTQALRHVSCFAESAMSVK